MNTNNEDGTLNANVDEVIELPDNATDDEKAEHYAKLEDNNKQLYARLKKAEGYVQKDGKWVKPEAKPVDKKPEDTTINNTSNDGLSQADVITLARTNIPEEDIKEVLDYAKFKNISVAEALKSSVVKATLAEKEESRKVAEATNTGAGRRGSGRISDESLLENSRKGILPDSDSDLERLALLRKGKR